MKKLALATAITLCLVNHSSAFAGDKIDQQKKTEIAGVGSGAVAGALVGGPLGGIIGAIFGAMIADDINDKQRFDEATAKLQRQDSQLLALQQQYEQVQQQSAMQLVSMDKEIERVMQEVEANIQFKTASYVIEDHFKSQLDLVAQGLINNPKLVVSLSGFADSRGDSTYNQALSEQRVLSVQSYLIFKGVEEKQVLTYSFGESQPVSAGKSKEDYFFDRRVLVRVAEGQQAMTASNL